MKYQFKGLGKLNALAIFTALASSPLAFLTTGVVGKFTYFSLTKIGSWAANKGLIFVNIGVEFIEGNYDQKNFDETIQNAIKEVLETKTRLTDEQKKAIDDKVIKAMRRFVILTKHN